MSLGERRRINYRRDEAGATSLQLRRAGGEDNARMLPIRPVHETIRQRIVSLGAYQLPRPYCRYHLEHFQFPSWEPCAKRVLLNFGPTG